MVLIMLSTEEIVIFRDMLDIICKYKEHESKINDEYMYLMNQGMDYYGNPAWCYVDRYQVLFDKSSGEYGYIYYVDDGNIRTNECPSINTDHVHNCIRNIYNVLLLLMNYNILELNPDPKMEEVD